MRINIFLLLVTLVKSYTSFGADILFRGKEVSQVEVIHKPTRLIISYKQDATTIKTLILQRDWSVTGTGVYGVRSYEEILKSFTNLPLKGSKVDFKLECPAQLISISGNTTTATFTANDSNTCRAKEFVLAIESPDRLTSPLESIPGFNLQGVIRKIKIYKFVYGFNILDFTSQIDIQLETGPNQIRNVTFEIFGGLLTLENAKNAQKYWDLQKLYASLFSYELGKIKFYANYNCNYDFGNGIQIQAAPTDFTPYDCNLSNLKTVSF